MQIRAGSSVSAKGIAERIVEDCRGQLCVGRTLLRKHDGRESQGSGGDIRQRVHPLPRRNQSLGLVCHWFLESPAAEEVCQGDYNNSDDNNQDNPVSSNNRQFTRMSSSRSVPFKIDTIRHTMLAFRQGSKFAVNDLLMVR